MGREAQKQQQPQPSEQQFSYTVEQLLAFNPYNPPTSSPVSRSTSMSRSTCSLSLSFPRWIHLLLPSQLQCCCIYPFQIEPRFFSWIWGPRCDSISICYLESWICLSLLWEIQFCYSQSETSSDSSLIEAGNISSSFEPEDSCLCEWRPVFLVIEY